jgi:hypothetical protein
MLVSMIEFSVSKRIAWSMHRMSECPMAFSIPSIRSGVRMRSAGTILWDPPRSIMRWTDSISVFVKIMPVVLQM